MNELFKVQFDLPGKGLVHSMRFAIDGFAAVAYVRTHWPLATKITVRIATRAEREQTHEALDVRPAVGQTY